MPTVTLELAKTKLSEIVAGLTPGCEWLITEHDQPVARIVPVNMPALGTIPQPSAAPGNQAVTKGGGTGNEDEYAAGLALARAKMIELFRDTEGFRVEPKIPREELYERGSLR